MHVVIDRLWDGRVAHPGEVARLELTRTPDGLEVFVDAPYHGDRAPPSEPGPTDGLWEYEVVELFLVGPAGPKRRYTEVELGPHGHHLVLRLEGVRQAVETCLPLDYCAEIQGTRWTGTARISNEILPRIHAMNAFAIHGSGAKRRYLAAWPVVGPHPDFHRIDAFPLWDDIEVDAGGVVET